MRWALLILLLLLSTIGVAAESVTITWTKPLTREDGTELGDVVYEVWYNGALVQKTPETSYKSELASGPNLYLIFAVDEQGIKSSPTHFNFYILPSPPMPPGRLQ